MSDDRLDHQPWPLRAALLLVTGAVFGLLIDSLASDYGGESWAATREPGRLALATWLGVSGILLAFTLERLRWWWSLVFALAGGAVVAGAFYWNGGPDGRDADDGWRLIASLLAIAIAAPLFQTMRDEGRRRLAPAAVHSHAWSNLVLWFAAWAFVAATWLLLQLLAELFQLIGIGLLRDALRQSWFNYMVIGAALGAAVGLLRDRDKVLMLLQRVATTVLSVLAPILAVGLALFVLALPFTGLSRLWDQTSNTTPILLSCVIGAILLINAVIGNAPEEEAQSPALRYSAMVLGAVMLPLVVVAGISSGMRIDQHGYTPSRLWACVFILIAAAFALRYLTSLIRKRQAWAGSIRRQNVGLAVGISLVALLLATPIVNFGAISARDQLARLQSGKVAPDRFDWAAMRFDFGRSGVTALRELREGTDTSPAARRLAGRALAARNRLDLTEQTQVAAPPAGPLNLRSIPQREVSPDLLQAIRNTHRCTGPGQCLLLPGPTEDAAILIASAPCPPPPSREGGPRIEVAPAPGSCEPTLIRFTRRGPEWLQPDVALPADPQERQRLQRLHEALAAGQAEIRTVPRRQLFVDGEPVGQPFE